MAKSREEVKDRALKLLVDAGFDDLTSEYLAELYTDSPQGREHQKDNPDLASIAAGCGTGLIPIF